jgi:ubiquinone/menaquinone biosynthesis C-methylase UbiE
MGNGAGPWKERQTQMERWYHEMVTTDWAVACVDADYAPLRTILSAYRGAVLDLGGGAGIARRYLTSGVRYVVLDPSLMWLDPKWGKLADRNVRVIDAFPFVQGSGEALPFDDSTFDVVLALWSLNHVIAPQQVFEEVR